MKLINKDYLEIAIEKLKNLDNSFCNDKLLEYNILIIEEELKKEYLTWDDFDMDRKIKAIISMVKFNRSVHKWNR